MLLPIAQAAGGGSSIMMMVTLWVPILLIFYMLFLRPQRKEEARRRAMLEAIKKNDRVLTAGGIYGVVANVRRDLNEVTIKVDETSNTRLRMTLGSITSVLGEEPSEAGK